MIELRMVALVGGMSLSLLGVFTQSSWGIEEAVEPSTIRVSAMGEVEMPPDQALVSLAVETAGESLEQVQKDNDRKMNQVINRLGKMGIKKEHIQTVSLNITPHYPPVKRRGQFLEPDQPEVPKIIGYTVRHALTVDVRELEKVGKIVDGALQAGANRLTRITWSLQNDDPVKLQALNIAANKAQAKAKTLAQTLNVKLGSLLHVTEGGAQPVPLPRVEGRAMLSRAMDQGGGTPIAPGELTLRASVSLIYEIQDE